MLSGGEGAASKEKRRGKSCWGLTRHTCREVKTWDRPRILKQKYSLSYMMVAVLLDATAPKCYLTRLYGCVFSLPLVGELNCLSYKVSSTTSTLTGNPRQPSKHAHCSLRETKAGSVADAGLGVSRGQRTGERPQPPVSQLRKAKTGSDTAEVTERVGDNTFGSSIFPARLSFMASGAEPGTRRNCQNTHWPVQLSP